jgi:outer membrane immunogenic protein
MRRLSSLMAATAAVGMVGSAASAADLALKTAPVPPPVYNWTGCYVGAQFGGGLLTDAWSNYDEGYYESGGPDRYGAGVIAGGQVGCNYQTGWQVIGGAVVVGIEGDGFWSSMKNTFDYGYNYSDGESYTETTTTKNRWDFDVAARFGLAYDRTLLYTKLGAAWGRFDFNYNESYTGCANCYTYSGSATLPGVLLGLGVEYAFSLNWTAKLEYNYIGFLQKSVTFNYSYEGAPYETFNQSIGATKQILKLGVNYKF